MYKQLSLSLFLGLLFSSGATRGEYLYPVSYSPEHRTMCLMHQHKTGRPELLLMEIESKKAYPCLLSRYMPAAVSFLPGGESFSFVDKGIVRIKALQKRSPRSIEFSEPIYSITQLHWLNPHIFYAHAKKGNVFGIFVSTDQGEVNTLVWDGKHDYRYPQIIGNTLFCIKQTQHNGNDEYTLEEFQIGEIGKIRNINFDQFETNEECDVYKFLKINPDEIYQCATCNKPSFCLKIRHGSFLNMVSEVEGLYISHSQNINSQDEVIVFECRRVRKSENEWQDDLLFKFRIPAELLISNGESRLFESILPFLPQYAEKEIYFASSSKQTNDQNIGLYRYTLETEKIDELCATHDGATQFFGAVPCENRLLFGGTMAGDRGVRLAYLDDGGVRLGVHEITL